MMGNYHITQVCHESIREGVFSAPSILDHWINWEKSYLKMGNMCKRLLHQFHVTAIMQSRPEYLVIKVTFIPRKACYD